jgi:hypothetical protein
MHLSDSHISTASRLFETAAGGRSSANLLAALLSLESTVRISFFFR